MRRLLIAMLLFATSPAVAALQVDPFPVATMMAETGLSDVVDEIGGTVADSIDQQDGPSDQSFIAAWKSVAGRMFDTAALNGRLAENLAANRLSTSDQAEIRAFYESRLGRHVTELDVASSRMTADQQDALYEQGKKLLPTLPPERAALYDEYWRVAAAPTLAISRQLVRAQVLATTLSARHSDDVPWYAVDDALDRLMPKVMPAIKDSIVSGNAMIYRELSDADMTAYLAFLKSPAAQRFYLAASAALDDVLGDEMRRFGDAVAVAAHGVSA
jgi:hypothetical protein